MLIEVVGDVSECPICTEMIKDSKILPCIHTFCQKCLEQLWKTKKAGDKVPCPVCRMEFDFPAGGVPQLPKNFFVEKLLDAQNCQSNMNVSNLTCDICSSLRNEKNKVIISAAEKHCLDCRQNLCSHCAKIHLVTKGLEQHQVNLIEESTERSSNPPVKHCDQHKDKKIEIYCLECKMEVCMACFISKHNGHKYSDISNMAEDLKIQIKTDIEKSIKLLQEVNDQSGKLKIILIDFVISVQETEKKIMQRGKEIKRLVDEHVKVVVQKLNLKKAAKIKELESTLEKLLVQKTSFDSFIKYSQTFFKEASLSDIASSASQLHTRFENLTELPKIHIGEPMEVFSVQRISKCSLKVAAQHHQQI